MCYTHGFIHASQVVPLREVGCASEGKDIDYLQMRLLSVYCLRMG
jgi:hypothetical protein